MTIRILVRGGGDLASGVIVRCVRAGWAVAVTELAQPLAVRRLVSFSQAIYDGKIVIEGIEAVRVDDFSSLVGALNRNQVPVLVDPECRIYAQWQPDVLVDARMMKIAPSEQFIGIKLLIGLGPGFHAGENCHAVVETVRGPFLGRVIWNGPAEANTGVPDPVGIAREERVLRAPASGVLVAHQQIGDLLVKGDKIAVVGGVDLICPFDGVLRGLAQEGIMVTKGVKIGDVDPRNDPRLCHLISDKSLAVGGGVLEAILSTKLLQVRYG